MLKYIRLNIYSISFNEQRLMSLNQMSMKTEWFICTRRLCHLTSRLHNYQSVPQIHSSMGLGFDVPIAQSEFTLVFHLVLWHFGLRILFLFV